MCCVIKKILFIGNSHTYFECLPFLFAEVCTQSGIEVHSGMCTHPGVDLQWHMNSPCTMPNLQHGKYDFVVIQQKAHPFDGEDVLIEQSNRLIKETKATGANAVITIVWSERNNAAGQEVINDAYKRLRELCDNVLFAPCGPAWHSLRERVDLYADDGEHQNSRGAYLNSCVLAKTIFGINPVVLPDEISFDGLTMSLSREEIRILQRTAATVIF